MHEKSLSVIADRYFKRFGFCEKQLEDKPHADMKLSIVIPCYKEEKLIFTLDSLYACAPPAYPLEVLIVVNSSQNDTESVKHTNNVALHEVAQWKKDHKKSWLKVHTLHMNDLPPKHAGVGLARKIGMDEALGRFASINYAGMIVCLDADCLVETNYLQELEKIQLKHQPQACTIHFEHDLEKVDKPALREGIIFYELFLRYYVNALASSHYPFAMHTVGSSMAVRADTYALSGGMNRRKAGEDFYFLHKVVPLGGFYAINTTTVYPSARISERVPFGTGKAQQEWLKDAEKKKYTYHPKTFEDLKLFISHIPVFFEAEDLDDFFTDITIPQALIEFLKEQSFADKLREMKANSSSYPSFCKRFFLWFDGFKALKFVHYCRDNYYGQLELNTASHRLLQKQGLDSTLEVKELLLAFRRLDKRRESVNLMLT